MTSRKLSLKQQKFVQAYVETGNATESARLAGYRGSDASLASIGAENLRKVQMRQAIDAYREELRQSSLMDAEDIARFYIEVIQGDDQTRDRLKAADQLTKLLGLNVPKKHDVNVTTDSEALLALLGGKKE
jgi:phage terminase small subunit